MATLSVPQNPRTFWAAHIFKCWQTLDLHWPPPPLPRWPVSWSTTQRPVETQPGSTLREMDRPAEGQRNPPGGPVEASDESWSPRSNATALAGYAVTMTTWRRTKKKEWQTQFNRLLKAHIILLDLFSVLMVRYWNLLFLFNGSLRCFALQQFLINKLLLLWHSYTRYTYYTTPTYY